jgi:hypothetical protein
MAQGLLSVTLRGGSSPVAWSLRWPIARRASEWNCGPLLRLLPRLCWRAGRGRAWAALGLKGWRRKKASSHLHGILTAEESFWPSRHCHNPYRAGANRAQRREEEARSERHTWGD